MINLLNSLRWVCAGDHLAGRCTLPDLPEVDHWSSGSVPEVDHWSSGSTHMLLLAREKPDPQSRQELRSRKFKLNSKLSFYNISMLLLLCAGDIESNPGPSVDPTQLFRFVNAAEILVGSSVAISDLTSGIYDASILKVDNDRFFAHFRGWNKSSPGSTLIKFSGSLMVMFR